MIAFNDRLKQLRQHLGLEQKEMAERLGIPARTYQDNERGLYILKSVLYQRLAEEGFSLDWLFTGRGSMLADQPNAYHATAVDLDGLVASLEFSRQILREHRKNPTDEQFAAFVLIVYQTLTESKASGRPATDLPDKARLYLKLVS